MNTVSHPEIIGLDVSRDWLDLHCLSDRHQLRLRNTGEDHSELENGLRGDLPRQRRQQGDHQHLVQVMLLGVALAGIFNPLKNSAESFRLLPPNTALRCRLD